MSFEKKHVPVRLCTILLFLLVGLLACKPSENKNKQRLGDAVSDGTYRTAEITQPDFTEYNATEKVFSELIVEGDFATYIAYKNGRERSRKTGKWDARQRSFFLAREGQTPPDRHAVVDITPDTFRMQVGRQGFDFRRVK